MTNLSSKLIKNLERAEILSEGSTTARSLEERFADVVNVKDFGAVGDGVTDDTAAIQTAVNEGSTTKKRVYIPSGTYNVSTSIQLRDKSFVFGDGAGTILKSTDGNTQHILRASDHCENTVDWKTFAYDITVRDIRFEFVRDRVTGDNIFTNWCSIYLVNVRRVEVSGCHFHNISGLRIAHALQEYGDLDEIVAANTDPDTDPAITAGFNAVPDDLNEDVVFNNNSMYIPVASDSIKSWGQLLRIHFIDGCSAHGNWATRGAMSGWGGNTARLKGGEPKHLRRMRNVTFSSNRLVEPNAMYFINADGCKMIGNTVNRGIDLGFDLEGCQNCIVDGNFSLHTGNGSLGVFYSSVNNVFSNNTCVEDGVSAKNINAEFNIVPKYDPSNSDTFYLNTGAHSPEVGEDTVLVQGNTFLWKGTSGSGFLDIRDQSDTLLQGNYFSNACVRSLWNNTGTISISDNDFVFTQDPEREFLIDTGYSKSENLGQIISNNRVTLYADCTDGSGGDAFIVRNYQQSNTNLMIEIKGNIFKSKDQNAIAGDVFLENQSINAGRVHTVLLNNNTFSTSTPLTFKEADQSRMFPFIMSIEGNVNQDGSPSFVWTGVDDTGSYNGIAYKAGTKIPYTATDMVNKSALGAIATEEDGIVLHDSFAWEAGKYYSVKDVCYTTNGDVYWVTIAGTSSVEPTGNNPLDGTLKYIRIGSLQKWVKYGSVTSEAP